MIPQLFQIRKREEENPGTFTFHLRPQTRERDTLAFVPGQFNMLFPFGAGEVAISLSGSPLEQKEWVHTVRSVGLVTRALERLQEGD